jgi:hypothetical protein
VRGDATGAAQHAGALAALTALLNNKYGAALASKVPNPVWKMMGRAGGFFPARDLAEDLMSIGAVTPRFPTEDYKRLGYDPMLANVAGVGGLALSMAEPVAAPYMGAAALGTGSGRSVYSQIGPGWEDAVGKLGEAYGHGGFSGLAQEAFNQVNASNSYQSSPASVTGGRPGYLH